MLSRRALLTSLATLSAATVAAGCRKRVPATEPNTVPEEGPPQEPPRPGGRAAPQR